ncbi:hypothetical protein DFQ30_010664 [Apophysomyces sp. BC1015]|nr:hypothetical protein DFQ30_010664 [Apophysomyces sp. BC1015]
MADMESLNQLSVLVDKPPNNPEDIGLGTELERFVLMGNKEIHTSSCVDYEHLIEEKDMPTCQLDEGRNNNKRPQVIQWDREGIEGQPMMVRLTWTGEGEVPLLKICFGNLTMETTQQQDQQGDIAWINLITRVPRQHGVQGSVVPLGIVQSFRHNSDDVVDSWRFGTFTYHDLVAMSAVNNDVTDQSDYLMQLLAAPYHDHQHDVIPSTSASTNQTNLWLAQMQQEQQQQQRHQQRHQQHQQQHQQLMQPPPYQFMQQKPVMGLIDTSYNAYQDYTSAVSTPITPHTPVYPYPSPYATPLQQQQQQPAPSQHVLPYHSAQLPRYNDWSHQHQASSVHPFAGVLNKANLKILGDLMTMTYNWTPQEWQYGRRLVRFWRRQISEDETSQVECSFEPVDQQEFQHQRMSSAAAAAAAAAAAVAATAGATTTGTNSSSSSASAASSSASPSSGASLSSRRQQQHPHHSSSSLVVSCIYWRERNDFFITSVDCISLLEGLIGVHFTVEEKNRIRRNLEGFRPLTVSKCKVDCADFFRLIMGFPHPKPRNIEKDVKVFTWKTLPQALRKIIRKYTPSYSSTANIITYHQNLQPPPPAPTTGVPEVMSGGGW